MTLDELLGRFEREYLAMHGITPKRQGEQLALLRRFAATLDHPLHDLTPGDLQTFIGAELAAGIAPNTGRKHMGMFGSFVNWCHSVDLIDDLRYMKLKAVGNPRGSKNTMTPRPYKIAELAEFRAVMAAKLPPLPSHGINSRRLSSHVILRARGRQPRMRSALRRHGQRLQFEAQVALALEAGLRRIEIYNLSIPALHYDNDELIVLTAKQGPGREVTRAIPYTQHARACMKQWLDFRQLLAPDHDFPWLHLASRGEGLAGQLRPEPFEYFGKSLRETFGPNWEWHRFRHTAATEWLRSKVPLEKVRVFMGHAQIQQTLAYTEILNRDINKAFGDAEDDFARRLGLAA